MKHGAPGTDKGPLGCAWFIGIMFIAWAIAALWFLNKVGVLGE